jgi:hypothetical protein
VGFARVERHNHFPTDVGAGAIIGTFVGTTVVHFNQRHRAERAGRTHLSWAPLFQGGAVGLQGSLSF